MGATALALLLTAASAAAQSTIFVGKKPTGDVIVDLSVLDKLGPPPPTARGPMYNPSYAPQSMPQPPGQAPVVLNAPGSSPAQTAKANPAKTSKAAKKQATASEQPAPPAAPVTAVQPAPAPAAETAAPTPPPPNASPAASSAPESTTATTSAPPATATPPATSTAAVSAPPASATAAPPSSPSPAPAPAASAPAASAPAAAAQASPPTQVASTPPSLPPVTGGDRALSINFDTGSAELSQAAKDGLGKLVDTLKRNADQRLALVAYAAGGDDQASQARRLSLTRALAVRSYLIEQGISSTRMDVRALGNKVEGGGPADRVDLVLAGK